VAKAVNSKTWAIPIRSNGQRYSAPPVTPPTAIGRTVDGATQVTLLATGGASSLGDNAGYRYRRDGVLLNAVATASAYINSGLTAGTTYSYTATLVDSAGNESDVSAAFVAVTPVSSDTIAPTVAVISAQPLSQSTIRVTLLTPSTDAGGFRDYTLQSSNTASGPWADVIAALQAASFPYTHAGLPASTLRYFRLLAFDTVGNSSTSAVVNATTLSSGSGFSSMQSIIATGGPFGTNPGIIESLAGPNGAIEQIATGAPLVPRADWQETIGPTATYHRIQATRSWSGSKAINCDSWYPGQEVGGNGNRGRFGIAYDMGATTRQFIADYLVYFDPANTSGGAGQWKIYRFTQHPDVNDANGGENFYVSRGGWALVAMNTTGGLGTQDSDFGDWPVNGGGWHRVRLYLRQPSVPGASDAIFRTSFRRMSDNVITGRIDRVNWRLLGASGNYFRYWLPQNYQGNGYGDTHHTQVWMDDPNIIKGSSRFSVIANAASWGAVTRHEFFTHNTWTNGQIGGPFFPAGWGLYAGPFWLYHFDATVSIDTPVSATGQPMQGA
jgi:hypothetical protein